MSIKRIYLYNLPLILFSFLCTSYYIYVVNFCVQFVTDPVAFYLYIFFYNIVFVMLLWSFLATVFARPAAVPEQYKLTDDEAARWVGLDLQGRQMFLQNLVNNKHLVIQTLQGGSIRYCRICQQIKPDRAHHCSVCKMCVLKMDHHCPWVNNCIGFSNYKFFILLMFYCMIYCIYVVSTTFKYVYDNAEIKQQNISVVVGLIMALIFGMVGLIFFLFNTALLARNETELEKMREPFFVQPNVSYNLGCQRNFVEVFGKKCLLWPVPVFTGLGTGYTFDLCQQ